MHEKILQAVTVGLVAGAVYFWLKTTRDYGHHFAPAGAYSPQLGDVRRISRGTGTYTECYICGDLVPPENNVVPLASDYLYAQPNYKPAVSNWNLGKSMNACCTVQIGNPCACGMAAAVPMGVRSTFSTLPAKLTVPQKLSCNPNVCAPPDCCAEVI